MRSGIDGACDLWRAPTLQQDVSFIEGTAQHATFCSIRCLGISPSISRRGTDGAVARTRACLSRSESVYSSLGVGNVDFF